MIERLEKSILGKIGAIKRGDSSPKEASIGQELNRMKLLDLALYEKLLEQYKRVLNDIKQ